MQQLTETEVAFVAGGALLGAVVRSFDPQPQPWIIFDPEPAPWVIATPVVVAYH